MAKGKKSESGKSDSTRKSSRNWRKLLRRVVVGGLALGVWGFVALAALIGWYAYDLPDVSAINKFNRRPSVTFVAADGTPIATYGDLYGGAVSLDEMSPYLPQAVLATEDRRFYNHFGLDIFGVARAALTNLRSRRTVQGGSTITQQLAKNVFLSSERSFRRKVQEVMLALWLEHKFDKDQILTIYLNRVYLGAGTYGVEAASQRYFGRPARDLSAHEAAVIAGLLKAPSRYSPLSDPERAKSRAQEVLQNEVEAGYMSAEEAAAAAKQPLRVAAAGGSGRGVRYFTDWLIDEIPGFTGKVDRDLIVVTTLDARIQHAAEAEIERTLTREDQRAHASQASLVVMTPDGAIRAMVGGRNYGESQFNRATDGLRQPGSAFKPFVFLAAVEAGMRTDDRFSDGPIIIGDWSPRNFEREQHGMITAREALARSVNTATVRIAQKYGIDHAIAVANRLGISSPLRRDLATALGASEVTLLELTSAFAPFANGGEGVLAHAISAVRDTQGNPVYLRTGSGPGRVIERGALIAMTEMLKAVVLEGTGRAAGLDRAVGGKTGTSQDFRDAWFLGFSADLVGGVWVGNDDGQPMERITGGTLPARIWHNVMVEAHKGLGPRELPGTPGFLERLLPGLVGASAPASPPPATEQPAPQRMPASKLPSATRETYSPFYRSD
jgi:penicillin-binding protein 1A